MKGSAHCYWAFILTYANIVSDHSHIHAPSVVAIEACVSAHTRNS